jgi:flagellar assembly protein FliH
MTPSPSSSASSSPSSSVPRAQEAGAQRLRTQPADSITIRRLPLDPARPIDYQALGNGGSSTATGDRIDDSYRTGYDAGFAAGQAAARAESAQREQDGRAQLEAILSTLSRTVESARQASEEHRAEFERSIPQFVFDVLAALVGVESALAADPGRQAIVRALSLDDSSAPAVIRLHPDDVATLGGLADLESQRTLTVVADPTVESGGAVVDIGETTIDSQLSAALDRVRTVLQGHGHASGVGGR